MGNGTEVAVSGARGLRDMLESEAMVEQIAKALPKHITPERMMRVALTAYQRNQGLWECDARSICGCIIEASELGLEPNGIIAHAYLVPYNNRTTGQKEAQLMIGYKGLAELALRSPKVLSIYPPEVVYEKDEYAVEKGMNPRLEHRPYLGPQDRGKIIAAYAIAKIANQDEKPFVWLTLKDLQSLESRSKAKSGPWTTDRAAMCKKSAIRQLCKYLPCRSEEQEAINQDELRDFGIMNGDDFVPKEETVAPEGRPQTLDAVTADLKAREATPEPVFSAPSPQEAVWDNQSEAMMKKGAESRLADATPGSVVPIGAPTKAPEEPAMPEPALTPEQAQERQKAAEVPEPTQQPELPSERPDAPPEPVEASTGEPEPVPQHSEPPAQAEVGMPPAPGAPIPRPAK